jgi:hypothetical protein
MPSVAGDPDFFFKNDPKMAALARAFTGPRKWGNIWYEFEKAELNALSAAEREKLEKARKNKLVAFAKAGEEAVLEKRIAENVESKRRRFTNKKGALKKIAKMCKWECQGEKCWAHGAKTCPFIHKGEPGWNERSAVPLAAAAAAPAAAGAGSATAGKKRRNRTMTRRRQRK